MIGLLYNIENSWINKHLRFVLAKKFNLKEPQITKDYLSSLTELDLSEENLNELNGLQYATNLTSLKLNRNNLKNCNYLIQLSNLKSLELNENKLEDINFISYLKNLETLSLESNNISQIPDLTNLKKLNLINISNNKINDLSPITSINSKNLNIIATNQIILLKPELIYRGSNYTFNSNIRWDSNTPVLYDNIQISGEYSYLETNQRTSFHYSISEANIMNITSDCMIKADFYHEVTFSKCGILSGVVIQPLMVRSYDRGFNIDTLINSNSILYGNITLQSTNKSNKGMNNTPLKDKTILLINANGDKIKTTTKEFGEFEFENIPVGQYTLLFPFISGYKYTSQSLYLINIKEDDCIEVNALLVEE